MNLHWKLLYPLYSWSDYGVGTILFYKDGGIGCVHTTEANLIFYAVQHSHKMKFLPFDISFKICKGLYLYSRILC